jgi:hypothetical protein
MRRTFAVVACVIAILGLVAPAAFAQVPAPKVTIVGLFDQVTSAGKNIYDGDFTRSNESEWYARTRFRPDFTFEVGRTKAVLGLEIDLQYGACGLTGGDGSFGTAAAAGCKGGSSGGLDTNTDVAGIVEIKWVYTEFDLTGKDSLLPFIPVSTVARLGGQPYATLANYKIVYANGDFGGVSARTQWAPNLSTALAYVMVENENTGQGPGQSKRPAFSTRGQDFAVIVSPEITPFKGLDIKPLYSYFHAEGSTAGAARRSVFDNHINGGSTIAATAANTGDIENRHTIGFDARWRSGPFSLDPTFYYQFGNRDFRRAGAPSGNLDHEADISAFIVDVQGGWQLGPLLLEARGMWTSGNKAQDDITKKVKYFEPVNLDTGYWSTWANIIALGIDYFNGGGSTLNQMTTNIGYDRYGRLGFGVKATYSLTPALAFYGQVNPTWTDKKVDTDTTISAATGLRQAPSLTTASGDSKYIGTEADLGMTWRFAPNTVFDLVGAYLFTGHALDAVRTVNGVVTKFDSEDGWTVAARVRMSF